MSGYPGYISAGADVDDSGFFEDDANDRVLTESLLQLPTYGDGYNAFSELQWGGKDEFFIDTFVRPSDAEVDPEASSTPPPALSSPSPAPLEAPGTASVASLAGSLDDDGLRTLLRDTVTPPSTSAYLPNPLLLANQPPAALDPNALYTPLTTSCFKTSAAAEAHRKRARLGPKSQAPDVGKVKAFGRDYWVVRIYNAMINSISITDGTNSVHRARFTTRAAFDPLDLEAAAHAVFDEAIAVHERGWIHPRLYHKNTVRGKLVDISDGSLELRLSRICLVLAETKSAVDDAVRGGVTLALLCDNPEARRFTKESNNLGNKKRGERLKQTSSKASSNAKQEAAQDDEDVQQGEEIVVDGEEGEESVDSHAPAGQEAEE